MATGVRAGERAILRRQTLSVGEVVELVLQDGSGDEGEWEYDADVGGEVEREVEGHLFDNDNETEENVQLLAEGDGDEDYNSDSLSVSNEDAAAEELNKSISSLYNVFYLFCVIVNNLTTLECVPNSDNRAAN